MFYNHRESPLGRMTTLILRGRPVRLAYHHLRSPSRYPICTETEQVIVETDYNPRKVEVTGFPVVLGEHS